MTRKYMSHLTAIQASKILESLVESGDLAIDADNRYCRYAVGWSDERVMQVLHDQGHADVSANGVAGLRKRLYGNLSSARTGKTNDRLDEIEKRLSQVEDMVLKLAINQNTGE